MSLANFSRVRKPLYFLSQSAAFPKTSSLTKQRICNTSPCLIERCSTSFYVSKPVPNTENPCYFCCLCFEKFNNLMVWPNRLTVLVIRITCFLTWLCSFGFDGLLKSIRAEFPSYQYKGKASLLLNYRNITFENKQCFRYLSTPLRRHPPDSNGPKFLNTNKHNDKVKG